jgi:hypothetical protein
MCESAVEGERRVAVWALREGIEPERFGAILDATNAELSRRKNDLKLLKRRLAA